MGESVLNVRRFGAVGDGKADDTQAIRAALAAMPPAGAVIYFPPGHYLTDTIYGVNFATFMGNSAFGYQEPGSTVISPLRKQQARLFDLNGKKAIRLTGLSLHGRDLGDDMHGVYTARPQAHEQNIVIENCRIEHFTGSGIAMGEAHVWCVRHCILFSNRLDGIDAGVAFDGWISDNQIAANGRFGLSVNNSVTITGNRIEHSGSTGLTFNRHYSQHVQVTGNLFCSNRGPAVEALEGNVRALTFTGNTFRNSALYGIADPARDCHVRLEGAQGVTFTGNALHVLWTNHPSCGLVLRDLRECVIAHNTLFKGATRELIRDLGGHRDCVIEKNPGSLKEPADLDP